MVVYASFVGVMLRPRPRAVGTPLSGWERTSASQFRSAEPAVGPTKGRKARSVPVPTFVLDELAVQCAGKVPSDLVFGGRDGGYLPRPKSSNGWFRRAVKAAGTQAVTPHDLRHTCASLAVSAGSMCLRCNGCLDTSRPRSRWTPTRTCLTTIWTRFRPRCMPGIRRKMWAKCGHRVASMVHSKSQNRTYLHKSGLSISAGGGIRTLKLFRAPAPKAGAVA
jgi:Phage integrase family